MALGLPSGGNGGGEDRLPILKYDARAGRIFRVDRSNASGSWETTQVEITDGFQAIFNLPEIEVGWLNFPAGGAPEMTLVKLGTALPPKPSDKHRSGYRVLMKLGKSSGGDVREMAANAGVSVAGMDELHTEFEKQRSDNRGKLPLVKLAKTIAIQSSGKDKEGKTQTSTNYQPVWEIVKWIDAPPEFGGEGKVEEKKAEPPPPPPPPADDGDEF